MHTQPVLSINRAHLLLVMRPQLTALVGLSPKNEPLSLRLMGSPFCFSRNSEDDGLSTLPAKRFSPVKIKQTQKISCVFKRSPDELEARVWLDLWSRGVCADLSQYAWTPRLRTDSFPEKKKNGFCRASGSLCTSWWHKIEADARSKELPVNTFIGFWTRLE